MARTIVGTVSSDKTDKTIVVTVHTRKTHPLYKKQYTISKKFMAHDEKNEAHIGDRVTIMETRPLSARKRYLLANILERATISQEESVEAVTQMEDPAPKEIPKPQAKAKTTAKKAEKAEDEKE